MRNFPVLILLLFEFVNSQPKNAEICGRSHNLNNLIDNGKLVTQNERRVVGGNESAPHIWPWNAQLIYTETKIHRCGAAILSDDIVITAAHCFSRSRNPARYTILIGGHEIGSGKSYHIRNISIHPLFNVLMPSSFDIAIARLHGKLNFSENVLPICLPTLEPSVGDNCIVTGWGFQEESGSFSSKLREIRVPIIPLVVCNSILHYFGRVDPLSMFCAGSGSADACQGDSGGPLVCYSDVHQRWELQGLVSWGHGCGRNNIPGVYAKISAIAGWAKSQMKLLKLNDNDIL
ncbi:Plasminogen [Dirofilaria immitis]